MSSPGRIHDFDAADVDASAATHARTSQVHIFALVRRLAEDVTSLFTKEIALLKVETTNAIRDTRSGLTSMAAGGAVLYAGILFLLGAAVLGLAEVMEPWLAALIVGAVVALIGVIMLASGRSKLQPSAFRPDHTRAALEKDRAAIKRSLEESRAGLRDTHTKEPQ